VANDDRQRLRVGYEAFGRHDLDAIKELLDPEIEWHPGDLAPEAGWHRGRDGLLAHMRSWLDAFNEMDLHPEEIVEDGERMLVMLAQRGRGTASGVELRTQPVHVWTIRDGVAVGWESHRSRSSALAGYPHGDERRTDH
jgi:ketosteroid isomerase-like protein